MTKAKGKGKATAGEIHGSDLTIPGRDESPGELHPLFPTAAFLPSHTIPNLTSGEDPGKHFGGDGLRQELI